MNLAQINIARMLAPLGSPIMKEFENNLDRINEIAERAPGFVWRLKDENNNATSIKVFDDEYIIVNMSVWENLDMLFDYVYKSDHLQVFRRKSEWFHRMDQMHMALWYTPKKVTPSVDQAIERLQYLRTHGHSPYSFTFKNGYTPEEARSYQPA